MIVRFAVVLALALASCVPDPPGPPEPPGELIFTEIAAKPDSGRPVWVELKNVDDEDLSLDACEIRNVNGDVFPILLELEVPQGEYLLLASSSDLGVEAGDLRVDAVLQDLKLRNSAAPETVELWCTAQRSVPVLVASATYNWTLEGLREGHSRQLVEDAEEEQWCEAPTTPEARYFELEIPVDEDTVRRVEEFGSPRAAAVCDLAGATPSEAGQLLFTEILVDHNADVVTEWFELWSSPANDGPFDLRGCVLEDRPHIGDVGTTRVHAITPDQGDTGIEPGERVVFAKATTTLGFDPDVLTRDGQGVVTYRYGSLNFNNSGRRALALVCPNKSGPVEIDATSYNWETFDGQFDGATLQVSEDLLPLDGLDASANDRPGAWCPAESLFHEVGGDDDDPDDEPVPLYGTPGDANDECPVPLARPDAGDVIFTELMGDPFGSTSEEWFELLNVGSGSYDLVGCRLENDNLDDGADHEDDIEQSTPLVIAPGQRMVFLKGADVSFSDCADSDYDYGSIGFNNTGSEAMILWCPSPLGGEVEVDRVVYDGGWPDGRSLQLPADREDAASNDDVNTWCETPLDDPSNSLDCPVDDEGSNQGTPGEGPNCG